MKRPRPIGRSLTMAKARRLVASLAPMDHSALRLSSCCGLSEAKDPTHGGVVRFLGESVAAFETDVTRHAFLETDLERVVPGRCAKNWQAFKRPVELRVRTKEVDERDLVVVVNRIGLVEDRGRSLE